VLWWQLHLLLLLLLHVVVVVNVYIGVLGRVVVVLVHVVEVLGVHLEVQRRQFRRRGRRSGSARSTSGEEARGVGLLGQKR